MLIRPFCFVPWSSTATLVALQTTLNWVLTTFLGQSSSLSGIYSQLSSNSHNFTNHFSSVIKFIMRLSIGVHEFPCSSVFYIVSRFCKIADYLQLRVIHVRRIILVFKLYTDLSIVYFLGNASLLWNFFFTLYSCLVQLMQWFKGMNSWFVRPRF